MWRYFPRLNSIELNYDKRRWRLDGCQYISLRCFKNALITLYNHKLHGLRVETRVDVDISLREAVDLLRSLGDRLEESVGGWSG